ncbi:pentapeptide repeat-containing protein [Angustibacter speluncae]
MSDARPGDRLVPAGREAFSGDWGLRLERLDLSGQDLTSVSIGLYGWIDRCSLRGADLRQAGLDRVAWRFCDLRGVDLRGASLRYASFAACDLRGADLRGADLRGAQFGSVLTGDDTGDTDLTDARIDPGALDGADVSPDVALPVGAERRGSVLAWAFPEVAREPARRVTSWLDDRDGHQDPSGCIQRLHRDLVVCGEPVQIPSRIYSDERERRTEALAGPDRVVAACLLTRHHDGHVRQRRLRDVLTSDEPWTAPFVVALLGEYVWQITADIALFARSDLPGRPVLAGHLRTFLQDNPDFDELVRQRIASYQDAYHRQRFAPEDNPARIALDLLRG